MGEDIVVTQVYMAEDLISCLLHWCVYVYIHTHENINIYALSIYII